MTADPFAHHPELRDQIRPSAESFFRTITVAQITARLAQQGIPLTLPFHDDATREALRDAALAGQDGDLWIFAYGSLIWDPALEFAELRRAHAPGHARRFILVDTHGGRGTEAAPGVMAALDDGPGCDGVAFRIAADKVDAETEILFRREMIAPGYHARFIPVRIDGQDIRALSFLADHEDPSMRADISRADQVRFAATGAGVLGTSLAYLESTVAHLAGFGIIDADASALLAEALAYRAAGA